MRRCVCGARAVHRHHIITRQVLRREGGDPRDERNLIDLCWDCHAAHHARSKPLPLRCLPDEAYDFADELMGPAAFDWLTRFYTGTDTRLVRWTDVAA